MLTGLGLVFASFAAFPVSVKPKAVTVMEVIPDFSKREEILVKENFDLEIESSVLVKDVNKQKANVSMC